MKLNKLKGIAVIGVILSISFGFIVKLYDASLKVNTLKNLKNVLDATHNSLHVWVDRNLEKVSNLAHDDKISNNYSLLYDYVKKYEFKCWFVINSDMEVEATSCERSLIYMDSIKDSIESNNINIFKEEAMFLPPVSLDGEHLSFYMSQMKNKKNFLILVKRNEEDLNQISKIGISGNSVESYFIDGNGYFLSGGRFLTQLLNLGIIDDLDSSIFSLQVKDPGGNLLEGFEPKVTREEMDFTLMAKSIIDKKSGSSFKEYNDYRGVPVYGQWIWDNEYNMGIAVEIDADEALESLDNVIWAVIIIFIIIVSLSSLIDYLIHSYLFKKAEVDRKEKIKFRSIFESSLDSIILFSLPDLAIMDINKSSVDFFKVNIEKIAFYNLYNLMLPGEKNQKLKDKIDKAIKEVINQRYYTFTWKFMSTEKEDFAYNISFVKIDIGRENYLQVSIGDISEVFKDSKRIAETAKLVAESASVTTEIAKNITKVSDSTTNVASQGEKIVTSVTELNAVAEQLGAIVELFKI